MNFPLVESLAINDGIILNAEWHEARYRSAYKEYYGTEPRFVLLDNLTLEIPSKGLFKLRIAYNQSTQNMTISPYKFKDIQSLKMIETNDLDYHLKFTDRTAINELLVLKEASDDILIINNGMVSDTSIGNVIFLKDKQWFTPDTPLLGGTQRAKLLSEGTIIAQQISKNDIKMFEAFQVINAMRPFDNDKASVIENILFAV